MDVMNWALMALSGSCNLEMALAGIEIAQVESPEENEPATVIPLNQIIHPIPDSSSEDDGSPALKIFYESIPGSTFSSL